MNLTIRKARRPLPSRPQSLSKVPWINYLLVAARQHSGTPGSADFSRLKTVIYTVIRYEQFHRYEFIFTCNKIVLTKQNSQSEKPNIVFQLVGGQVEIDNNMISIDDGV